MKLRLISASILTLIVSCQSSQVRQPNQDHSATIDSNIDFDFIHTQQNCKVPLKVPIDEAKALFHKKHFVQTSIMMI
jgi:hypothetical protein